MPTKSVSDRTVIVYERRPRWAPELQRQFAREDVQVRSCRSTADLTAAAESIAGGLIVLDLDASPGDCLQFLGRHTGRSSGEAVIAVGSKHTAELEWPLRELGAVEVLFDSATGENLARVCRRQWRA